MKLTISMTLNTAEVEEFEYALLQAGDNIPDRDSDMDVPTTLGGMLSTLDPHSKTGLLAKLNEGDPKTATRIIALLDEINSAVSGCLKAMGYEVTEDVPYTINTTTEGLVEITIGEYYEL